jgi:antitoxin ParD1/3/4
MPDVQKISVALTGKPINALKAAVATGEYATTCEIVREAIRDRQFKRALRQEDLRRLRQTPGSSQIRRRCQRGRF